MDSTSSLRRLPSSLLWLLWAGRMAVPGSSIYLQDAAVAARLPVIRLDSEVLRDENGKGADEG